MTNGDEELEDEVSENSDDVEDEEKEDEKPKKTLVTDNSTTLFIRNLPFTTLDADLKEHFNQFGPSDMLESSWIVQQIVLGAQALSASSTSKTPMPVFEAHLETSRPEKRRKAM